MASPGELVKVLADVLGIPEPTVTQYDRALLVSGLRSKGGRGPSAAKVVVTDAVNVTTAILSGTSIKDAHKAVRRFMHAVPEDGHTWKSINIPELDGLPEQHSFLDAFEAVIQAGANGILQRVMGLDRGEFGPSPRFSILVHSTSTVADIVINAAEKSDGRTCSVRYGLRGPSGLDDQDFREWEGRLRRIDPNLVNRLGDMREYREIGLRTVLNIAALLSK